MIEVNLAIALTAGMLATFNPCGFAMLPAYLGALVLGQDESDGKNYLRALRFSLGMSIGLTLVFICFALVVLPISGLIERYLPFVTIVMAAILLGTGVMTLMGKGFGLGRLVSANFAPGRGLVSQIGYGITFALASLSCTIGPFLAVTATALRTANPINVLASFVSYAVGMALVILLLSLLTASSGVAMVRKIRTKSKLIEKIVGGLLILVAIYLASYASYELALFSGQNARNPVVDIGIALQTNIASFIYRLGAGWLSLAVVMLSAVSLLAAWKARKSKASG